MIVFNERPNLRVDRCPIKAHHKELAHLPVTCKYAITERGSNLNNRKGFHRGRYTEIAMGSTGQDNMKKPKQEIDIPI
jgi:hypothetical protein